MRCRLTGLEVLEVEVRFQCTHTFQCAMDSATQSFLFDLPLWWSEKQMPTVGRYLLCPTRAALSTGAKLMSPAMSAFALSSIMMFTLCNSEPVPMEHLTLHGVETFVNWSNEQDDQEVMTVMLLFHGCNNQGYDWFRKPEEISFLREALSHTISLVAFTTPRHRGNFCWPSEGSEFEEVRDLIGKALLELLQLKAKSASSTSSSLILVGASSGGNFARESQTTQRDPIESHEATQPWGLWKHEDWGHGYQPRGASCRW